jgi:hypothetical protein
MPPRIGLAVLAVAMVPSAVFYLLNVRALRVVGADDPFNAIGLARRRIEQLAGLEPGEHTAVAVIELASVADLARVSVQTVDPALLEEIDSMRAALLAGSPPDPLAVTAAIEALRSAATAFDEPATATPTIPPPATTEPERPAPVTWGRRAARRTSP